VSYPASELVIDPVLIRKYDLAGPRYTSYPTADRFIEAFGEAEYRSWLGKRNIGGIVRGRLPDLCRAGFAVTGVGVSR